MINYMTIQGDTWDLISYKVYSDERHIGHLIHANPMYRYVVIFSADKEIKIPDRLMPQAENSLPPWKK